MASAGGNSKDSISLNLNPMLDVFSILITFLLMSFSTDPVSYDVNPGLELPESSTLVSLDEVPSITVTKADILVNGAKLVPLVGGDAREEDRAQGAIMPLFEELKKLKEAGERVKPVGTKEEIERKNSTLTLEMDKDHRFKLMKRIMLSGQQAKFVTFKLVVQKELN